MKYNNVFLSIITIFLFNSKQIYADIGNQTIITSDMVERGVNKDIEDLYEVLPDNIAKDLTVYTYSNSPFVIYSRNSRKNLPADIFLNVDMTYAGDNNDKFIPISNLLSRGGQKIYFQTAHSYCQYRQKHFLRRQKVYTEISTSGVKPSSEQAKQMQGRIQSLIDQYPSLAELRHIMMTGALKEGEVLDYRLKSYNDPVKRTAEAIRSMSKNKNQYIVMFALDDERIKLQRLSDAVTFINEVKILQGMSDIYTSGCRNSMNDAALLDSYQIWRDGYHEEARYYKKAIDKEPNEQFEKIYKTLLAKYENFVKDEMSNNVSLYRSFKRKDSKLLLPIDIAENKVFKVVDPSSIRGSNTIIPLSMDELQRNLLDYDGYLNDLKSYRKRNKEYISETRLYDIYNESILMETKNQILQEIIKIVDIRTDSYELEDIKQQLANKELEGLYDKVSQVKRLKDIVSAYKAYMLTRDETKYIVRMSTMHERLSRNFWVQGFVNTALSDNKLMIPIQPSENKTVQLLGEIDDGNAKQITRHTRSSSVLVKVNESSTSVNVVVKNVENYNDLIEKVANSRYNTFKVGSLEVVDFSEHLRRFGNFLEKNASPEAQKRLEKIRGTPPKKPGLISVIKDYRDISKTSQEILRSPEYLQHLLKEHGNLGKALFLYANTPNLTFAALEVGYGFYLLDKAHLARDNASRNHQMAESTSTIVQALAGTGVEAALLIAQSLGAISAGAFTTLAPLAIFVAAGITIDILLRSRAEKLAAAEKLHLTLHNTYHKYETLYEKNEDLFYLNTLTGMNTLSFIKDKDVIINKIDLSNRYVTVEKEGALHLHMKKDNDVIVKRLEDGESPLEAIEDIDNEPGSLYYFYNGNKELYHENNEAYRYRLQNYVGRYCDFDEPNDFITYNQNYSKGFVYRREILEPMDNRLPKEKQPVLTDDVQALILPTQTKFTLPWTQKTITTEIKGVFVTNYQLGARMGKIIDNHFIKDFWTVLGRKNRHMVNFDVENEIPKETKIKVKLPEHDLDILYPVSSWSVKNSDFLNYHFEMPDAHQLYYKFVTDFFGAKDSKNQKTNFRFMGGTNDTLIDVFLGDFDLKQGRIKLNAEKTRIEVSDNDNRRIDFYFNQTQEANIVLNYVKDEDVAQRAIHVRDGVFIDEPIKEEHLNSLNEHRQKHILLTIDRKNSSKESLKLEDDFVQKQSLFISNATKECVKAKVFYQNGNHRSFLIPEEDTLQIDVLGKVRNIKEVVVKSTRSIKSSPEHVSRTIPSERILNNYSDVSSSACMSINEGYKESQFSAQMRFCDESYMSYLVDKKPISGSVPSYHKKLIYKINHDKYDGFDQLVKKANYKKVSIDNRTGREFYVSIRYNYEGRDYHLAVEETLIKNQPVLLKATEGSRVEYFIPEGAVIKSFLIDYSANEGLRDVVRTTHDGSDRDLLPKDSILTDHVYIDVDQKLFVQPWFEFVTPEERSRRYRVQYEQRLHVSENPHLYHRF